MKNYELATGLRAQPVSVVVTETRGAATVSKRHEIVFRPGEVVCTTHDLSAWVAQGILIEMTPKAMPVPVVVTPKVVPVVELSVAPVVEPKEAVVAEAVETEESVEVVDEHETKAAAAAVVARARRRN
jgi:hypothetical protein